MSYRLFGAETSAYSSKMRAFVKYKGVPFDWTPRTQESEDELKRMKEKVQQHTDAFIKKSDEASEAKEKEVMTV